MYHDKCFQTSSTDNTSAEIIEQVTTLDDRRVEPEENSSCIECNTDIISIQSYVCYEDTLSTRVIYCVRLEGILRKNSSSLVLLLEDWVRDEPNITVNGSVLEVDTECSVAISSLDEGECQPAIMGYSGLTYNIAAIIGGVVAVTCVIFTTALAVVIVVLRRRHGKLTLKNAET